MSMSSTDLVRWTRIQQTNLHPGSRVMREIMGQIRLGLEMGMGQSRWVINVKFGLPVRFRKYPFTINPSTWGKMGNAILFLGSMTSALDFSVIERPLCPFHSSLVNDLDRREWSILSFLLPCSWDNITVGNNDVGLFDIPAIQRQSTLSSDLHLSFWFHASRHSEALRGKVEILLHSSYPLPTSPLFL